LEAALERGGKWKNIPVPIVEGVGRYINRVGKNRTRQQKEG